MITLKSTTVTHKINKTELEKMLTESLQTQGDYNPQTQTITFSWGLDTRSSGYGQYESSYSEFNNVTVTITNK